MATAGALAEARTSTAGIVSESLPWALVSVYVDNAFAVGDWGRWSGGGHLQADTVEELHAFADRLGLRREWFQCKPGRPENDHYDLGRRGRERALELGAIEEDRAAGTRRRQGIRRARRESGAARTVV